MKWSVKDKTGYTGVIQPTTSALFHNTSTIAISLKGMSGWKKDTADINGKQDLPQIHIATRLHD